MNISSFMTWFISQVIIIFTFTYSTLNNITFGGTSLLKVIIFINVIIPFLYIMLTIAQTGNTQIANETRRIQRERKKAEKKKGK